MGKSPEELVREIAAGHFPPCFLYKILYSCPEGQRVKPAWMMVDVDGANGPLSFSCRIKEKEMCECIYSVHDTACHHT